jgi:hypothetical protein
MPRMKAGRGHWGQLIPEMNVSQEVCETVMSKLGYAWVEDESQGFAKCMLVGGDPIAPPGAKLPTGHVMIQQTELDRIKADRDRFGRQRVIFAGVGLLAGGIIGAMIAR